MKSTNLLKTMLLTMALLSGLNSKAQNTSLSFQISSDVSGSGLGGNICPNISFTKNKQSISIGPNIQRRKMNFSGLQMNYRYSVTKSENNKLELFFAANAIMHNSAYLSKGSAQIEEKILNKESKTDYQNMQQRIIEYYGVMGLKVNTSERFNIVFNLGVGMYNTINKQYNIQMYRQKSALSMQLGLGLIYNFKK